MRLEFTYTPEDLAEGNRAVSLGGCTGGPGPGH